MSRNKQQIEQMADGKSLEEVIANLQGTASALRTTGIKSAARAIDDSINDLKAALQSAEGEGIAAMVQDWHEWQCETFPGATAVSKIHHLKEEVGELIEALETGTSASIEKEFADCFALLFGSAYISGMTMQDIVRVMGEKLKVNKGRKWGTPDSNGVVKHIE